MQHPLFDTHPPNISVCLSFDDIEKLQNSCQEYVDEAHRICGAPVNAREVFQKSMPNVNRLSQLSRERLLAHIEQWKGIVIVLVDSPMKQKKKIIWTNFLSILQICNQTVQRAEKMAVNREAAEKERQSLVQQIEDKRQRIIDERREAIDLDRRNEQIQNDMEVERLARDNAERMSRLRTLVELDEIADRQLTEADDQIAHLHEEIENGGAVAVDDDSTPPPATTTILNDNRSASAQIEANRNRCHNIASSIFFGDLCVKTDGMETNRTRPNVVLLDDNLNPIDVDITGTLNVADVDNVTVKLPDPNATTDRDDNCNVTGGQAMTSPATARKGLRTSLSLELRPINDEQLLPTPMSTTSDYVLDTFDMDGSRNNNTSNESEDFLSAHGSSMEMERSNRENNNNDESLAPMVAPISPPQPNIPAKVKVNRFAIESLATPITSLSHTHDPCTSSTPIKSIAKMTADRSIASRNYSIGDLCTLNVTNLTNFLHKSFSIPLHAHYTIVNNEILRMFLVDLNVFSHFNSLRNYFLMMDSEFSNTIFSGLIKKLETITHPSELINSSALHSILGNALHSNMASVDKNIENVSFAVTNVPDAWNHDSPDVFNAIMLTYHVDWPLNLVIGTETIDHYGYIFQHLLKMQRVAYALEQTFFVSSAKHSFQLN